MNIVQNNITIFCNNKEYKIHKKREKEKESILCMIEIYCKHNHKEYHKNYNKTFGSKNICRECEEIYHYACERTDRCRFIETKTFCSACPSPCYKKDMKEKIKKINAFSEKRMLFYRPITALKHIFVMIKHNFNKNKKLDFKGAI